VSSVTSALTRETDSQLLPSPVEAGLEAIMNDNLKDSVLRLDEAMALTIDRLADEYQKRTDEMFRAWEERSKQAATSDGQ
jgi:hypothetical protein